MPQKDPEAKRAYMREWYARPENHQRVIDKVTARKKTAYAGVCLSCGGPTVGSTPKKIPRYCGKPECRKALWRVKNFEAEQEKARVIAKQELTRRKHGTRM